MHTKRSFSLLQLCVVIGVLAVGAQGAIAQVTGYGTPGARATQPRWSRASLYGARPWTPRPQSVVQPQIEIAEDTATTTIIGTGTPIINTNTSTSANTNTNTNTNANIVIVRPQYPSYYGYGGYGGYAYGYPGYRTRATSRYFDRGLFNAMPGPFGLSSFRPLEVTTIP